MQRAHKRIREFFYVCRVYQAHIPTYPSGHWLFGFASKAVDPIAADIEKWNEAEEKLTEVLNNAFGKDCIKHNVKPMI